MGARATSLLVLLALDTCRGACTVPANEVAACTGKSATDSCSFVKTTPEATTTECGTCKSDADCGLKCAPNGQSDCAQQSTSITCSKQATGTGGFGIAEPCQDTSILDAGAFTEPLTLASTNGKLDVELSVEQYRLDTGAFAINVRAYCFGGVCMHPGPTIATMPGDVVTLTLKNNLGTASTQTKPVNELRHPNVTNVHTHGLHVDPFVDNVVLGVHPGEQRRYTYTIPSDHMPGTHWYHSHLHGSSAMQVMGGLAGAWTVGVPSGVMTEAVASTYSAMPSHIMVVTHVSLCTCNPTSDPFRIYDYQYLASQGGSEMPLDATVAAGDVTDVLLVNGQRQPTLALGVNVWTRFELVNAVGDVFLELEVRTGVALNGGGEPACSLRLLALDGVFLNSGVRAVDHVCMPPGGRASVAVLCATAGTFYLQSNPMGRAADHEASFLQNLVSLSVAAASGGAPNAEPAWGYADITRPPYLQDLRAKSAAATWQMSVEQTGVTGGGAWLGVGSDCAITATGRDGAEATDPSSNCPHVAFGYPEAATAGRALADYPYRHVGRLCDVEDVVVHGRGATPHPMHIHVNHFQIVAYERNGMDATGEAQFAAWGELGDWRDTFPALAGTVTMRHVLDKYGGNIMVHCHFLPHEDMGMMDRFWVGAAETVRCTASGGGDTGVPVKYCSGSVPADAFADAYPQVVGSCGSEGGSPTDAPPTDAPPTDAPPAAEPTPLPAPPESAGGLGASLWVLVCVSVCLFVL